MIAGDHLYTDPGHAAAADGGDSLGAWRVDHALEAEESQASGDMAVLEPRVIGGRVTAGKGQHPQPIGGHALDGLARVRFVERDELAVICRVRLCNAR